MSILKDLKKKHKQIEAEIVKLTKKRLNDRMTSSWKSLKDLKKTKLQMKDTTTTVSSGQHEADRNAGDIADLPGLNS